MVVSYDSVKLFKNFQVDLEYLIKSNKTTIKGKSKINLKDRQVIQPSSTYFIYICNIFIGV